jgi:glycosyltransferase involved in cell wall biosynthesis
MKIIALLPIKNEAWIIDSALANLELFCDLIIVADQNSTDNSRKICLAHKKTILINNPNEGHSNQVRWQLLAEARKHGSNNLLLCVDADEIIPPALFKNLLKKNQEKLKPGIGLEFTWIQLWKSFDLYNTGYPWGESVRTIGWIDDQKLDYKKEFVQNDHTSRTPLLPLGSLKTGLPLLHLQWVNWQRAQIKQAWYRCTELIRSPKTAFNINSSYALTLEKTDKENLLPTPREWLKGISLPKTEENPENDWHLQEIFGWFEKYGIEFFEPLEIWHIPELKNEFIKKVSRNPRPLPSSSFLLKTRNWIKYAPRKKISRLIPAKLKKILKKII